MKSHILVGRKHGAPKGSFMPLTGKITASGKKDWEAIKTHPTTNPDWEEVALGEIVLVKRRRFDAPAKPAATQPKPAAKKL